MTRDQKRLAIEGPVAVGGGQISTRLVNRLLNDVGDNQDQLPIMQHALMRTWDYWTHHQEAQEPMDIHHYEAIGCMAEALSMHANEAFDELNEEEKIICVHLFKTLTELGASNRGVRRPSKMIEVMGVATASEDEVSSVVEHFRMPGRSFIMPPPHIPINQDSVIDISHESLMRIWERLSNWVNEEAESADMYMRLSEASALYQVGKAGLWRPPDLQLATNWQLKQKPTLAWANRYNPAFERAMVFLETSKKTYEEEQKTRKCSKRK